MKDGQLQPTASFEIYILRIEDKTIYVGKGVGSCFQFHGYEAMDKEAQGKCKQSSAAPVIRQAWVEQKSVGHYHYHLPEMTNRGALSEESAAIIANISPFLTNKNMGDTYAQLDFN